MKPWLGETLFYTKTIACRDGAGKKHGNKVGIKTKKKTNIKKDDGEEIQKEYLTFVPHTWCYRWNKCKESSSCLSSPPSFCIRLVFFCVFIFTLFPCFSWLHLYMKSHFYKKNFFLSFIHFYVLVQARTAWLISHIHLVTWPCEFAHTIVLLSWNSNSLGFKYPIKLIWWVYLSCAYNPKLHVKHMWCSTSCSVFNAQRISSIKCSSSVISWLVFIHIPIGLTWSLPSLGWVN